MSTLFPHTAAESVLPPVTFLSAAQLRRYPSNRVVPRDVIERMAASIREVGVLQPITVRPKTDDEGTEFFEIVLGESRWLGAGEIDLEYAMPCLVRRLDDKDAARIHAVENFQRTDLDPIDEANAMAHLRSAGWEVDEMLDFLGKEKSYIYNRLSLLKLSADAHAALRAGDLSLKTAEKLASLADDIRPAALEAVLEPVHGTGALPQARALELIEREFVIPAAAAKDWIARRDAVCANWPLAKWQAYDEAVATGKWRSGYEKTEDRPAYHLLSAAAQAEEIPVPTWGELAKRHGAPMLIGIDSHGAAAAFVLAEPLIDAEKAACEDKPGDCIFPHEEAARLARLAMERRAMETEAHETALATEKRWILDALLDPSGVDCAIALTLAARTALEIGTDYVETADYGAALGMDEDASEEEIAAGVVEFLAKDQAPCPALSALGRLLIAGWVQSRSPGSCAEPLLSCGLLAPEDFPAHELERVKYNARVVRMSAALPPATEL